jgi:hypothetical protein
MCLHLLELEHENHNLQLKKKLMWHNRGTVSVKIKIELCIVIESIVEKFKTLGAKEFKIKNEKCNFF